MALREYIMSPEERFEMLYNLALKRVTEEVKNSLNKYATTLDFYENNIRALVAEASSKADKTGLEKQFEEMKGRCAKLAENVEMIKMSLKSAKFELKDALDDISTKSVKYKDCQQKCFYFENKVHHINSVIDELLKRFENIDKKEWRTELHSYRNSVKVEPNA